MFDNNRFWFVHVIAVETLVRCSVGLKWKLLLRPVVFVYFCVFVGYK